MKLGTNDQAAVRDRLQALADKNNGRLTPQAVVEDARDEASPLNPLFEWNMSKGFEKYLVNRARELIRSVRIVVKTSETTHRTPVFVRDPTCEPRQAGYVSVRQLRNDTDLARERVVAEFAAAAAALRRAKAIAAALDVGDEVDGLLVGIDRVRDRVLEPASAHAS